MQMWHLIRLWTDSAELIIGLKGDLKDIFQPKESYDSNFMVKASLFVSFVK